VVSESFKKIDSCVDYHSYEFRISDHLTADEYAEIRRKLMALGKAEQERMGVIYVRGPWGFMVVPHFGFPALRVSFFHDTPQSECQAVLKNINAVFSK